MNIEVEDQKESWHSFACYFLTYVIFSFVSSSDVWMFGAQRFRYFLFSSLQTKKKHSETTLKWLLGAFQYIRLFGQHCKTTK